jgi:hypothetical protein
MTAPAVPSSMEWDGDLAGVRENESSVVLLWKKIF